MIFFYKINRFLLLTVDVESISIHQTQIRLMIDCFQEDEGAKKAGDADSAVLHAKTGHQVKKKKEWYI